MGCIKKNISIGPELPHALYKPDKYPDFANSLLYMIYKPGEVFRKIENEMAKNKDLYGKVPEHMAYTGFARDALKMPIVDMKCKNCCEVTVSY